MARKYKTFLVELPAVRIDGTGYSQIPRRGIVEASSEKGALAHYVAYHVNEKVGVIYKKLKDYGFGKIVTDITAYKEDKRTPCDQREQAMLEDIVLADELAKRTNKEAGDCLQMARVILRQAKDLRSVA